MSWKCHRTMRTKTLPIPSTATKERRREKICDECQAILVQLPSDKAWGLIIGDAGQGMLYVVKVKRNSEALKAGIEEGDYLYNVDDKMIDVMHTPLSLTQYVEKLKDEMNNRQKLNLKLMRKIQTTARNKKVFFLLLL